MCYGVAGELVTGVVVRTELLLRADRTAIVNVVDTTSVMEHPHVTRGILLSCQFLVGLS